MEEVVVMAESPEDAARVFEMNDARAAREDLLREKGSAADLDFHDVAAEVERSLLARREGLAHRLRQQVEEEVARVIGGPRVISSEGPLAVKARVGTLRLDLDGMGRGKVQIDGRDVVGAQRIVLTLEVHKCPKVEVELIPLGPPK